MRGEEEERADKHTDAHITIAGPSWRDCACIYRTAYSRTGKGVIGQRKGAYRGSIALTASGNLGLELYLLQPPGDRLLQTEVTDFEMKSTTGKGRNNQKQVRISFAKTGDLPRVTFEKCTVSRDTEK